MFADIEFARRLASAFIEMGRLTGDAIERVRPDFAPAFQDCDGFGAIFCGDGSPLTQTTALIQDTELSAAKYRQVEEFYSGRAAKWEMQLGPFSHPKSWKLLQDKGWRVVGFENSLFRELETGNGFEGPSLEVVRIKGEDRDDWAAAVTEGFFGDVSEDNLLLAKVIAGTEGSQAYAALVDGNIAGGATLVKLGPTAFLGGMSTLKAYRGRGVQRSLTAHRLSVAASLGCDLAIVETEPGSQSQRNMERLGFRVGFTRSVLALG